MNNFPDIVATLGQMKEIFAFSQIAYQNRDEYPEVILRRLNHACGAIDGALRMIPLTFKGLDQFVVMECTLLNWSQAACYYPLKDIRYITQNNNEWYYPLGDSWSEVPLPPCIDKFFRMYVFCLKYFHSGMLGVVEAGMSLPVGASAISYPDLSNIAIVFQDKQSQEAFENKNAVEPCSHMAWDGAKWAAE